MLRGISRGGFFVCPRGSVGDVVRDLGGTTTMGMEDLSTVRSCKDSLTQGLGLGDLRFRTIRNLSQKCPSQH